MRLFTIALMICVLGCQSFDSNRNPASKAGGAESNTSDGRDVPAGGPTASKIAQDGGREKKAAFSPRQGRSLHFMRKKSHESAFSGDMKALAKEAPPTENPDAGERARRERAQQGVRDRLSQKAPRNLSINERREELNRHYAQRTPQAERACNSVQISLRSILDQELKQYRTIQGFSAGTGQSMMALTKSRLSYLNTSRSASLSSAVIQDQADIIELIGAYPRRVRLSQLDADDSVMLVGRNGYNMRLDASIEGSLTNALDSLNNSGAYIRDVELAKDQPGYVVVAWPNEKYVSGDYSGYYAQGIPSNLSNRLSTLYSARRFVSLVALGVKKDNHVPWILVLDKNSFYTSDVDSDVVDELEFLRSIDARISNIDFDRQGGLAISYTFDDMPYTESVLHFQVGEAPPAEGPKEVKVTPQGSNMLVSFDTRADHTYDLQESTDMKTWQTVESFAGNGANHIYTAAAAGPRKFWRVNATSVAPACDRVVSIISPDMSYVDYSKPLDCRSNGSNYQPYNNVHNKFVGRPGYGFNRLSDCQLVVQDASRYAVCNWNGSNYSPYNTDTGVPIGRENYGFSSIESCRKATLNANTVSNNLVESSVICNWDGSQYHIYQAVTSKVVGSETYGFSNFDVCTQATSQMHGALVCGTYASAYVPYHIDGTKNLGREAYGFTYLDSCLQNVQRSSTFFACNYYGTGYQPYSVDNNTPVYRAQMGYGSVDMCQQTTELSGNGNVCNFMGGTRYGLFNYEAPASARATYTSFASCKAAQ